MVFNLPVGILYLSISISLLLVWGTFRAVNDVNLIISIMAASTRNSQFSNHGIHLLTEKKYLIHIELEILKEQL